MHQPSAEPLLGVVQRLSSATSLEAVMVTVRTAARQLTGADGATFVLREDSNCYYADEDAIAPLWKGRRFPMDTCISGWVMRRGEVAVIPDIYADARIPHDAYRPTFVKSLVMVPVRPPDAVAAIGVYWAEPHAATEDEVATVRALADAAALALANVQLYTDLQRALERERSARIQAEESARLKDQFLAVLSHELRTPLNVIQGWVWQLQRAGLTGEVKRAIDVIERNAALQTRLVEDLLDTSRAIAGKLHLTPQLLDVASVCEVVADTARPAAEAKHLTLEVRVEGQSPIVRADPDRFQQIVWNLVINAVKFTPEGGRVEVLVQHRGTRATVTVTDTGAGIAPEFLPHVFETFRQGDGSTTRLVGGLGLGLTIVRQLVELHGGTVRVESEGEGRGTRATLEMPIPAIREEASAWLRRRTGVATRGARLDGLTILVVDDEADACEAVGLILQQHGATVLTATSAARALALMEQQRPDVLVSDLAMPETDGFALIRQVRALSAMVPAAALSAHPASEHRRRAEEAGYQLYLEKPVTADELTSKLAQLALDGRTGPH